MFVAVQPDERQRLVDVLGDRGPVLALHARSERDVGRDVTMREERVVLEHQPEAPAMGWHARKIFAIERDAPAVRRQQTGDGPQHGALPAATRSEQRDDLARRDVEIDIVDGHRGAERHPQTVDVEGAQNSPRPGVRKRSIVKMATAVITMSTVLIAIAAPKLAAPAWDR